MAKAQADPLLRVLLRFMVGAEEGFDELMSNGLQAAQAKLADASQDSCDVIVSGVAEPWLRKSNPEAFKMLRRVTSGDDTAPLKIDTVVAALVECTDAGMVFGACLMYELLRRNGTSPQS